MPVSEPTYEIQVERNVAVPMRDGTTLRADVYRPHAEGQYPVLVGRVGGLDRHLEAENEGLWLFGKGGTSKESAKTAQQTANVREMKELISQLASLTENQVADFLVFGNPPPKPVKMLCELGPQVVPLVTSELESSLAGARIPAGAGMSMISLAFVLCTIGTRECLGGILRIMDYSTFTTFTLRADRRSTMMDPFEWLYNLCARTIGRIGEKSIVPELVRIIQDPRKDHIGPSACEAVGLLRAPEARQALTVALALKLLDESA